MNSNKYNRNWDVHRGNSIIMVNLYQSQQEECRKQKIAKASEHAFSSLPLIQSKLLVPTLQLSSETTEEKVWCILLCNNIVKNACINCSLNHYYKANFTVVCGSV